MLLAAAAAVLVVAAPAQAKIPSGEGWSARWHYYATDSIEISATLPGARALAYVSDVGGTRRITGTLTDDASDGRCARVVATVPGVGTIDDKKLCTGGSVTFGNFNTSFNGWLYVFVYEMQTFGTDWHRRTYLTIPPSDEDPGLRTVGTGAAWVYTSATTYAYNVRRPGVQVIGNGHHEQSADGRTAYSTVEKQSNSPLGCATGKTSANKIAKSASACGPYGTAQIAHNDIKGPFSVEACDAAVLSPKRCLSMYVDQPS